MLPARRNVYDQSFSLSLSSQFKLALTFLRQAVFQLLGEDYAHLHFPHHEVKYAQYNYPQCNTHGYLDMCRHYFCWVMFTCQNHHPNNIVIKFLLSTPQKYCDHPTLSLAREKTSLLRWGVIYCNQSFSSSITYYHQSRHISVQLIQGSHRRFALGVPPRAGLPQRPLHL